MARVRHRPEQIIRMLREAEVEIGKGDGESRQCAGPCLHHHHLQG